jgi:hypothetical protein
MLVLRIIAVHFIVLTALAVVPNGWAQDSKCLSIRILNAKSGKPIRGVRVDMFPDHLGKYVFKMSLGKTDSSGTLQYCASDSAPKTFILSFYQFGSGWDGPEAFHRFNLDQVLCTERSVITKRRPPDSKTGQGREKSWCLASGGSSSNEYFQNRSGHRFTLNF